MPRAYVCLPTHLFVACRLCFSPSFGDACPVAQSYQPFDYNPSLLCMLRDARTYINIYNDIQEDILDFIIENPT